MTSKLLVSSVMIFLNAEKFIEEAIESVFAQTYDNWELLLVDDGSSDDSSQIALRYAERYPEKVRYLEHPGHQNRGMSASRNLGIRHAKGEYISFLDADDVWFAHTLEQQLAVLSSHPEAGMVYGSSLYWFGWTGNLEDSQRDFRDFVEECGVKPNTLIEPPELLRTFLRRDKGPCVIGSIPVPSTIMVRREVAESVGGFVEESHEHRGQYDDQFFYVKVGLSVPVIAADKLWSKYRQHSEATTYIEREANRHTAARLHWLNWIAGYLFEREVKDVGIWKLLHEEQVRIYNRRLKKLERALKEERQKVRQRRAKPAAVSTAKTSQKPTAHNSPSYKTWRLLKGALGRLRAEAPSRTTESHCRMKDPEDARVNVPTVALLPWGDVWEDYLDMIEISLEEFLTEVTGTWLFGYVEALKQAGVRPVLVLWSREARHPQRRVHLPTGTAVWVLPLARTYRVARRFAEALSTSGRWALPIRYIATQPRTLARVLRQERCGAVIVQEYENPRFDVCVALGRWLGLPVLATFQGGDRPWTRLEGWVRRWTVPAAAGLLVGSGQEVEAVAERYRLPPEAVTLVPNPIDVGEWTPGDRAAARSALGLPAEVPVACWHGRTQVKHKGLDILVEAWQQVCAERPGADLRLLLCGSSLRSKRLRRLIEKAGLRGVHWRDEYVLDREVIRSRLAASDVFVLPSRQEGFAVAPMEAMACGRPVVASDAHGVSDLLAGGEEAGGVVVPREDPGALARELGRLLDDRALAARLGEAARRRVVERYSPEAVGAMMAVALHRAAPERFPAPPARPPAS